MSVPARLITSHFTLDRLLRGLADAPPIIVGGISSDSRKLERGDVFFACQGATSHGLEYLDQAVKAKVAAVVWDSSTGSPVETDVPMIPVAGLAEQLGRIANRWYDAPSKSVRVTGVTGTNGKTTVAWLIRQSLKALNSRCAYVGTVGSGVDKIEGDGSVTTPACFELHGMLARYRDEGAEQAAIEVSSHALDQSRVDGVQFESAVFTNLSRDHIDYHGSMSAYFEAKASLFLDYDVKNRIVGIDTDYGEELAQLCGPNVVTVSTREDRVANGRPYVYVRSAIATSQGSLLVINSSWGNAEFTLPLAGDFNVANAAEVLAFLLCQDVPLRDACRALGTVSAPPGRMERVRANRMDVPAVFVDYSHTPASLEAALRALRHHCDGKLWCVFGCGGDRDRGKRAMMGQIAAELADYPVVTSDNPRSEAPEKIIADVLEGMPGDALTFVDRAQAIAHAVTSAAPRDIVLIAGKGHENYQVIGNVRSDFSDVEVAREVLRQRAPAGGER